ncbi:MAG: SDR family oxidoreductase [Gammaproteobacteria bacterium]|nr:SDR family oxidoreductase [Gammaproteobacteria bacterium]
MRFRPIGSGFAAALALVALAAAGQHELTGEIEKPAGAKPIVVVAGATGRTGRRVLDELARDGRFLVRALARDAATAKRTIGGGHDWRAADVTKPESLLAPLRGATYLISTIGATERSGPNSPEFVDYGGVRHLVDAASRGGVRQFVLVSSVGVEGEGGFVRWILNFVGGDVLVWKKKGEAYLRASGLGYTIVRPGGLRDGEPGSKGLRLDQDPDAFGDITRADTAVVVVATLGNEAALGKSFSVVADDERRIGAWRQEFTSLAPDR